MSVTNTLPPLATNIRRLRVAAGLSQFELAKRSGVTLSTIGRLESELGDSATLRTAASIASVLGCSIDDLLAEVDSEDTARSAACASTAVCARSLNTEG